MLLTLDTNIVSELARRQPHRHLIEWFRDVPDHSLHLSVLTLGEIRKGVEALPEGRRKERLRLWLEQDLPAWFGDRILPVTKEVADRWGRVLAEAGRPAPAIGSLLAATALHHSLRLVTRNDGDFVFPGLGVGNPWRRQP